MSDAGAVGRNVVANQVALERASQRNGGQNIPASPPSSVTGADPVPSRAVNTPVRQITDEGPGGPDLTEQPTGDDLVGSAESAWEAGTELAHIGEDAPVPHLSQTTMPDTFGVGPRPDTNANRSWNASDIFNNTRIG